MPVDKWGLKLLYPSKSGGFSWFQKDDIEQDSHWEAEEHMSNVGGGSFTMNFSGPTSGVIYTDPNFANTNAIGGCNMDFSDAESRGYVYKSSDPKDIELKFIMNTDLGGGFSVSQTAGKHSGSGCCSGFAYMINMECETNPVEFRFRKEMWHVSYHTDPRTGDFTHSDFDFKLNGHGNVGIGLVKYIRKDGISSGKDSVVLEFWGNPDPDDDPLNWILIKRTEDKGEWGNDGDDCGGNKDQVGTWGMPKFRLKSNSTGSITFKHVSLREIDATADFDDPNIDEENIDQPSTTSTVLTKLRLQRDINVIRSNPCSAGGYKTFYNHIALPEELDILDTDLVISYDAAFYLRNRVGERCDNNTSHMKGKKLAQLDVLLKKTASPAASPTIGAVIRNNNNSIVYSSPTTIDPTTLTTDFAEYTFDFSSNTRQFQTGDKVTIEWDGGDADNYIEIGIRPDHPDTGSSLAIHKNEIWTYDANVDLAARMWEDQ